MFVGRNKEINELNEFISSANQKATLIYGKRRVGKTSLLKHVLSANTCDYIFFEALDGRYDTNLELLTKYFEDKLGIKLGSFSMFLDLFRILGIYQKPLLIIIDEYQYLKQNKPAMEVDSEFKQIIDNLPGNIKIILTVSHVTMMKELLEEENPLFGRFQLIQNVRELNYHDAQLFYRDKTPYEKACIHSVFGGCPYILENIGYGKSIKENIISLLLRQNGVARNYIEYILFKELGKVSILNDILRIIGNGKVRYSQIESSLNIVSNGLLSKYLALLQDLGLIAQIAPINRKNDKKKSYYSIVDNLVCFYYTYVFPNIPALQNINENDFYDSYIEPSLKTFISYRFEGIVMDYLRRNASDIEGCPVLDIGRYWYDNPETKENGEFDTVIQLRDYYRFYEVKFLSRPMSRSEIESEADKIRKVKGLGNIRIGFASINGFAAGSSDDYILITGDDLYS